MLPTRETNWWFVLAWVALGTLSVWANYRITRAVVQAVLRGCPRDCAKGGT